MYDIRVCAPANKKSPYLARDAQGRVISAILTCDLFLSLL